MIQRIILKDSCFQTEGVVSVIQMYIHKFYFQTTRIWAYSFESAAFTYDSLHLPLPINMVPLIYAIFVYILSGKHLFKSKVYNNLSIRLSL